MLFLSFDVLRFRTSIFVGGGEADHALFGRRLSSNAVLGYILVGRLNGCCRADSGPDLRGATDQRRCEHWHSLPAIAGGWGEGRGGGVAFLLEIDATPSRSSTAECDNIPSLLNREFCLRGCSVGMW